MNEKKVIAKRQLVKDRKIIAVIAILCICLVTLSLWKRLSHREWTRVAGIRLTHEDFVEVGWETEWDYAWGKQGFYYNYFLLNHKGEVRRFFISCNDHPLKHFEMRWTKNPLNRLWIMADKQVVCSFEIQTGRFINAYGAVMDYKWSYRVQEESPRPRNDNTSNNKVIEYPAWATEHNGIVIIMTPD